MSFVHATASGADGVREEGGVAAASGEVGGSRGLRYKHGEVGEDAQGLRLEGRRSRALSLRRFAQLELHSGLVEAWVPAWLWRQDGGEGGGRGGEARDDDGRERRGRRGDRERHAPGEGEQLRTWGGRGGRPGDRQGQRGERRGVRHNVDWLEEPPTPHRGDRGQPLAGVSWTLWQGLGERPGSPESGGSD